MKTNIEKETDKQPFIIRSYSKVELAQLYLPHNAPSTAVRKFNKWLQASDILKEKLALAGGDVYTRHYTRRHVEIIVGYLGEP